MDGLIVLIAPHRPRGMGFSLFGWLVVVAPICTPVLLPSQMLIYVFFSFTSISPGIYNNPSSRASQERDSMPMLTVANLLHAPFDPSKTAIRCWTASIKSNAIWLICLMVGLCYMIVYGQVLIIKHFFEIRHCVEKPRGKEFWQR